MILSEPLLRPAESSTTDIMEPNGSSGVANEKQWRSRPPAVAAAEAASARASGARVGVYGAVVKNSAEKPRLYRGDADAEKKTKKVKEKKLKPPRLTKSTIYRVLSPYSRTPGAQAYKAFTGVVIAVNVVAFVCSTREGLKVAGAAMVEEVPSSRLRDEFH